MLSTNSFNSFFFYINFCSDLSGAMTLMHAQQVKQFNRNGTVPKNFSIVLLNILNTALGFFSPLALLTLPIFFMAFDFQLYARLFFIFVYCEMSFMPTMLQKQRQPAICLSFVFSMECAITYTMHWPR